MFLYANLTSFEELDLNKDWELIKFKQRLKQNYILKKSPEFLLIRLKFLDNHYLKNSIQIESYINQNKHKTLRLSGRTDLKPLGFVVFLALSFVFYIGVIYMYLVVKKARQREIKEMQTIANLSLMI
jgi:hypothetical protein